MQRIATPPHIEQFIRSQSELDGFYVYDAARLRQQLQLLSAIPPNVAVYYAMKANPFPKLLGEIAAHPSIAGIEIASLGEAKSASKALDGDFSRIIFTGPAKGENELEHVIANGIRFITVESILEGHRVSRIAAGLQRRQPILLRISTDREIHGVQIRMSTSSTPTPFGVSEAEAAAAIEALLTLPGIELKGVHFYSATGVLDAAALIENVDYCLRLVKDLARQTGYLPEVIDLGGGFGVDYKGEAFFDIQRYASGLSRLQREHGLEEAAYILEIGRYITAEMGYFTTRIQDIKSSHGSKVIVCRAGTNAHRRPYALQTEYPISIVQMNKPPLYSGQPSVKGESAAVHGPLCTPADRLSKGTLFESAAIGDLVVMHKAGAYGLTMSSVEFLSHARVPEFFLEE